MSTRHCDIFRKNYNFATKLNTNAKNYDEIKKTL